MLDQKIKEENLNFQRNEITEHNVYKNLAQKNERLQR